MAAPRMKVSVIAFLVVSAFCVWGWVAKWSGDDEHLGELAQRQAKVSELEGKLDEKEEVVKEFGRNVVVYRDQKITAYSIACDPRGVDMRGSRLVLRRTAAAKDFSKYPEGSVVYVDGVEGPWVVCDTGSGDFDLDLYVYPSEMEKIGNKRRTVVVFLPRRE